MLQSKPPRLPLPNRLRGHSFPICPHFGFVSDFDIRASRLPAFCVPCASSRQTRGVVFTAIERLPRFTWLISLPPLAPLRGKPPPPVSCLEAHRLLRVLPRFTWCLRSCLLLLLLLQYSAARVSLALNRPLNDSGKQSDLCALCALCVRESQVQHWLHATRRVFAVGATPSALVPFVSWR